MSVVQCVRIGAVFLGLLTGVASADAADPYYSGGAHGYGGYKDPPLAMPVSSWQGFYIGAHVGSLWSEVDAADNVVFVAPNVVVNSNQSTNLSGLLGGGQIGFNMQSGSFVYGVEADLGGMDNGSKSTFLLPATGHPVTVTSDAGWYGDLTLRGGMTYGDALFYAKGGLAFFTGGVSVNDWADAIGQNSGTFTGWTVGGGLEYMIGPRWSLKAEYLYYDFGNNNCCFSSSGRFDDSITMHTVKVGLNFHMNSGLIPLN